MVQTWLARLIGTLAAGILFLMFFGVSNQLPWFVYPFAVLLFWNIITFLAFGWDKSKGGQIQNRVPERVFFVAAAFGGAPGILYGSQVFHHKTSERKKPFRNVVWFWLIVDIVLGLFVLYMVLF